MKTKALLVMPVNAQPLHPDYLKGKGWAFIKNEDSNTRAQADLKIDLLNLSVELEGAQEVGYEWRITLPLRKLRNIAVFKADVYQAPTPLTVMMYHRKPRIIVAYGRGIFFIGKITSLE